MPQMDQHEDEGRLRIAETVSFGARLGVVILFGWGAFASQRALAAVEHAQQVTQTVERVRLQQLEMRLHNRGFLLSGNVAELRALAAARGRRDDAWRQLERLAAGASATGGQVAGIRVTLDSGDVIGERLRSAATASAEDNQRALTASGLIEISDAAAQQLAALLTSEQATLFAETARQHRALNVTMAAAGIAVVLAALIGVTTLRYRRRNTNEIAAEAATFRRLAEDNPDGVLVHIDYNVVYANAAMESLLRASGTPIVGRRVPELVYPDDRTVIDERTAQVAQKGIPTQPRLIRFLRDDGGICEAEARGAPITFGGVPAVQVVLRDLSARRDAERALQQSEERFRAVLATMSEGVVLLDADMSISLSNPAAQRILGLSADQLAGRTPNTPSWRAIDMDGESLPPEQHYAAVAMRSGWPASGIMGVERPTHDRVWISVHAVPLFREGSTAAAGVVATFADITARMALEEQLRQAQKMEVMGRMASGVAHDFNNLLTIIRSASELLRINAQRAGLPLDTLDDIDSATDRAAALTAHLLTFSRRQHAAPALVCPAQLVHHAMPILRRLAGDGVTVEHCDDGGDEPGWVWADPVRFEQVLVNLVSNAKDAMPSGGTVRILTGVIELHEHLTHRFGTIDAGRYVTLSVEDTGTGMSHDVLDHLFDPFYTTKPQGRGTGLGLSIVYGVVHEALGTIMVQSEPGRGSRLTAYWPRAEAPAAHPANDAALRTNASHVGPGTDTADVIAGASGMTEPVVAPRDSSPPIAMDVASSASELILLVDDEEHVRKVVAKQLEASGYVVMTAESGHSALAMLRNPAFNIRAVVSDVRMPEMTGIELVTAMLAEQIDRPVLLVSGQMDTQLPSTWQDGGIIRFLAKPLSGVALRRMVGELVALGSRSDQSGR